MEKLIEFLLSNIYIVIVVGGFLLSLLGKLGGKKKGETSRMPDFGGGQQTAELPRRQRSVRSPASSGETGQMHRRREAEGFSPAEPRPLPHAVRVNVQNSASKPDGQHGARAGTKAYQEQPAPAPFRTVPETPPVSALRQAVVWSEILGPPRAKRPMRK